MGKEGGCWRDNSIDVFLAFILNVTLYQRVFHSLKKKNPNRCVLKTEHFLILYNLKDGKEGGHRELPLETTQYTYIYMAYHSCVGDTDFILSRGKNRDRENWVTDLFLVTPFRESPSMSLIAST